MKVSEVEKLGLMPKTVADLEVSVGDVITDDEFNMPNIRGKPLRDYRNAAIDRLVGLKVAFSSNCNIVFDVLKRFVKVTCPYCGAEMKATEGGGNCHTSSITYVCPKEVKCGARVYISTLNDGVSFTPPKKGKE